MVQLIVLVTSRACPTGPDTRLVVSPNNSCPYNNKRADFTTPSRGPSSAPRHLSTCSSFSDSDAAIRSTYSSSSSFRSTYSSSSSSSFRSTFSSSSNLSSSGTYSAPTYSCANPCATAHHQSQYSSSSITGHKQTSSPWFAILIRLLC